MAPPSSPPFPSHGAVRKRTASAPPALPTPAPQPPGKKYRSLKEIMLIAKRVDPVTDDYYGDVKCELCRLGDCDDELLLCDACDKGFHIFCIRPILARVPTGPWFCPGCAGERQVGRFSLTQKKIVDFFRIQKCSSPSEENCGPSLDVRRRKRRSLVIQKRKRRLLPFTPAENLERRHEQMASLATALKASQMEFSNNLTFMPGMAPKSANQARYEKGGIQILSKDGKETLDLCKAMLKRGECPPLLVVFDSHEGFTVEADDDIKDLTLITEYCGDVDYISNREHDDCDSMMTLLLANDPSASLVVCPDKRGNIACFISGINNHTLAGRKKQNMKCVRYDVNGECRALLVACRDISKGERLYYDYNGYVQEYPTQHFV